MLVNICSYRKALFGWLLLGLFVIGCSSGVKKVDIPATADPRVEIKRFESDLQSAVAKNIDVLAEDDFSESRDYLDKAKKSLDKGKSQSETIESIRIGRGYLQRAYETAGDNESKAEDLFKARQMALGAGAAQFSELRKDLRKTDEMVSDLAEELDTTSAEKLANIQKQYVVLEVRAVMLGQLGRSQAIVNGARESQGRDKAPLSYKNAELSLKTAEAAIATNVRNPDGYAEAVKKANQDARQLQTVLAVINKNGGNLAESVAINLVAQNRKISGLRSELDIANEEEDEVQSRLSSKAQALAEANEKLVAQSRLDEARSRFSEDEAEAYQQGNNLIIRLKKVNFANGRADLPKNALPLLDKVNDVLKDLHPSQIVFEGHTDSVGPAPLNKKLSERRADAVAEYFKKNGFEDVKIESEGFGFEKPIATNKSKMGRAQNRRVDIVITPSMMDANFE